MKDELDDWEALCRDENSFAYLISAKDTASAVPRYPLDWVGSAEAAPSNEQPAAQQQQQIQPDDDKKENKKE
jgi:hypothetical protein